jgi:hypothetical protein
MNEHENPDQLDQSAGDQLDAGHQDQLDQPTPDELEPRQDATTGNLDTAPTFPDPTTDDGSLRPDPSLIGQEPVEGEADDHDQATAPNPYSPGYGVTGKFPDVQDDGFDTGAGDQADGFDAGQGDTEDQ